jgi:hypothetical protein
MVSIVRTDAPGCNPRPVAGDRGGGHLGARFDRLGLSAESTDAPGELLVSSRERLVDGLQHHAERHERLSPPQKHPWRSGEQLVVTFKQLLPTFGCLVRTFEQLVPPHLHPRGR